MFAGDVGGLDAGPECDGRGVAGLLTTGRLRYDETIVDGLERAPEALTRILEGTNMGKMLVHLADPV